MLGRQSTAWPAHVDPHHQIPEITLFEALRQSALAHPDRVAVHFQDVAITYAELIALIERQAGFLQQHCGLTKGDRVLLYMQNSPQYIIAYYAILRADMVVIPVNPMNHTAEIEHLIRDTGARVAFSGQEVLDYLRPLMGGGLLDWVIAAAYVDMADPDCRHTLPVAMSEPGQSDYGDDRIIPWATADQSGCEPGPHLASIDDYAVIPYSSGTTGQPKGCVHSHRTIMPGALCWYIWSPPEHDNICLATLPFFHVTGMQMSMNGPLTSGGTLVLLSRWDRARAAELIREHRVTRWRSISTMMIDLVNDPDFDSYDLSSLEAIGGGGAAMPDAIAAKVKDLTGLDYIEGYGMTETMASTHLNPVHAPRRQCLGIPIYNVDSRIIDLNTGAELGVGEAGEVVTHAPQVFVGYWQRPDDTEAVFVELDGKRFLKTGDIAMRDEQGYFTMVDRAKRMINASGFKVWPAEVEALMHRNDDIVEACIIGVPDARRGEAVKAIVVLRDPENGPDEAQIKAWCHDEMAAYKCPNVVEFVDSLPKSASGKVMWRELSERAKNEGQHQ